MDAISFNGNITAWYPVKASSMSSMFAGTSSFTGTKSNLTNWQTSSVKDLSKIFERSTYRGSLSNWNTSQVTDFSYMFYQSDFNGDISRWDVRKGVNFAYACK
jgi:Mycoplasma protein of unknown function, DUF285